MNAKTPVGIIVAGTIALLVFVLSAVVLILTDHSAEGTSILGSGLTFVGLVFGVGHLSNQQQETTEKVDHLANGEMEGKIRQVVAQEHARLVNRLENWTPANRPRVTGGQTVDVTDRPADAPTSRQQT